METAVDTYGNQDVDAILIRARVDDAVFKISSKFPVVKPVTAPTNSTFGFEPKHRAWAYKLDFLDELFPQEKPTPTTQPPIRYAPLGTLPLNSWISFVRNHLQVPYASELADRLDDLHEASIEEAPEQSPISTLSLYRFINFLQKEQNLEEPDVVLSDEGHIVAEWHKSRREHFSVEFMPDGQARYVIFSPDPDYPSRTNRVSGLVSADTLMKKAEPFNVLSWAAR